MMKTLLTLILLIATGSIYGQQEEIPPQPGLEEYPAEPPPPPAVPEDAILDIVDEIAQFPGGQPALSEFLMNNIVYPKTALDHNKQGKCYVRFVVNKKGKINEVRVLKGVPNCPECNEEAVRVVKNMPRWVPAKNDGTTVNCYFTLPISFKLN